MNSFVPPEEASSQSPSGDDAPPYIERCKAQHEKYLKTDKRTQIKMEILLQRQRQVEKEKLWTNE
jgi:hypothetical protein